MKQFIFLVLMSVALIGCKNFNGDVEKAFEEIEKSSTVETAQLKKVDDELMQILKDSAVAHPERYAAAYSNSLEFYSKTDLLVQNIEKVKDAINEHAGMNRKSSEENQTADAVLFTDTGLSETGDFLLESLADYNTSTEDQLFFTPAAEKHAEYKLSIDNIKNRNGEMIEYMNYHFKGYPTIATRTKLTAIQRAAYEVEEMYLNALIEKPQF